MHVDCHIIPRFHPETGMPFLGECFLQNTYTNYIVRGGSPRPYWFGGAAPHVQLTRHLRRVPFARALQALHQRKEKSLIDQRDLPKTTLSQQQPNSPAACIVLKLETPITVSASWAVAGEVTRRRIEAAVRSAAEETLRYGETNMRLANSGAGPDENEFAKMLAALRFGRFNAAETLKPNLHIDACIMNLCRTEGGRWKEIDTALLRDSADTLGLLFRCALARRLRVELGLRLFRPKNEYGELQPWFEIKGVPTRLCEHWSTHSNNLTLKDWQPANSTIQLSQKLYPPEYELIPGFRNAAKQFSFTQNRAERLLGRAKPIHLEDAYLRALPKVVCQLAQSHSSFTSQDAIRGVLVEMQHIGVPLRSFPTRVRNDLANAVNLVPLGKEHGLDVFSTDELWRLDRELVSLSKLFRDQPGIHLQPPMADRIVANIPALTRQQANTVYGLLAEPSRLKVFSGTADSPDNFAVHAVQNVLGRIGFRVIGAAVSTTTAADLARQAAIPTRTVSGHLHHLRKGKTRLLVEQFRDQTEHLVRSALGETKRPSNTVKFDSRTVLVLKESHLLGFDAVIRLLRRLHPTGATLIMAGNAISHQPGQSTAFSQLVAKYGQTLDVQDPAQSPQTGSGNKPGPREASAQGPLLVNFDGNPLYVCRTPLRALNDVVTAWADGGGAKQPARHAIHTLNGPEANFLNRRCQQIRRQRGHIPSSESVQSGDDRFYPQDRVVVRPSPMRSAIKNARFGTVIQVDAATRAIVVRFDQTETPNTREESARDIATIAIGKKSESHVALGYASTAPNARHTPDHLYVLLGFKATGTNPTQLLRMRGRVSTTFFSDESRVHNYVPRLIDVQTPSSDSQTTRQPGNATTPTVSQQLAHGLSLE